MPLTISQYLSNFGCKIIFMYSINIIFGISKTPTHCLKEALVTWPLSGSGLFICISFMVYLTFLPFSEGLLPFNTQYLWLAPTPTHFPPTPVYCRKIELVAKIQKYENVQNKPNLASHVTSSLFNAFNKTSRRQVITWVLQYRMLVFQSFWYWWKLRLKFTNKNFLDCLRIMQFLTNNYLPPECLFINSQK